MMRRLPIAQLSIRQMLILVAYSAVVCAFVVPLLQEPHRQWRDTLLMFDAVAMPLSLSVLSLVLLRDGPLKVRLVAGFMGLAVLAMLAVLNFYVVQHLPNVSESLPTRVSILGANAALLIPALYLAWRAFGPGRPRGRARRREDSPEPGRGGRISER